MNLSSWKTAALAGAAAAALAGCFGGGDDPVLPAPPMLNNGTLPADPLASLPATSTATLSALLTYQFLVLQSDPAKADRAEPIDLSNVTLPTSDTTEPADV